MKNIKINTIIPIFLLVLLLIIGSFDSLGLYAESNYINNNIEKNNFSSSSSIRIKSESKLVCTSIITKKQDNIQNLAISSVDDKKNIPIAKTLANESYPSMVIKEMDGLIAYEYKDGAKPYIYLRNTKDFGQNWSNANKLKVYIGGIDTSVNSPSLSIDPNNGYAYGAFLSEYNNSGAHGVFMVPDISGDISNINPDIWDWSNVYSGGSYLGSWWGFKDMTIKYHNYNNVPWITSFIGSTNYSNETGVGPVKNAVMYGYLGPVPNEMWIQWEPKFGNCNNLSVAMSDDSKIIYGVSERLNGSNIDLLYFNGSYQPGAGSPYLDLYYHDFSGFGNLYHPKIYVKKNNIYIAAENSLKEIVLYKSINSGKNWIMYNVTSEILPSGSNPKYPDLFADETNLYCTFIESGNILITSSQIGIINWTKPIQLNDFNGSVVSNYRFSDMVDINHIVWTDARNGNYDLYSFVRNIPEIDLMVKNNVYITSLGYPLLQTKNMINFTIVNLGNFPVNDVDIKVTYSCIKNGIKKGPIETEYPGYITFLNGNAAEKSFNLYLFRINLKEFLGALISFSGIQNITVTVDPEKKYKDTNLNDNSVTISVSYKELFPVLYPLEKIFLK